MGVVIWVTTGNFIPGFQVPAAPGRQIVGRQLGVVRWMSSGMGSSGKGSSGGGPQVGVVRWGSSGGGHQKEKLLHVRK